MVGRGDAISVIPPPPCHPYHYLWDPWEGGGFRGAVLKQGNNGDCVPTSDHMSESHRLCVIQSVAIHDPCPPTSANGRNGLTVVGSVGLCAVGYGYGWIWVCEIRSVGCIRGPDALLTIHLGLRGKTVPCSLSQLPDVAS